MYAVKIITASFYTIEENLHSRYIFEVFSLIISIMR